MDEGGAEEAHAIEEDDRAAVGRRGQRGRRLPFEESTRDQVGAPIAKLPEQHCARPLCCCGHLGGLEHWLADRAKEAADPATSEHEIVEDDDGVALAQRDDAELGDDGRADGTLRVRD